MTIRIYLDNCCFNRPFDYTKWQRTLWEDQGIEEISSAAMRTYANSAEQQAQPDREKRGSAAQ